MSKKKIIIAFASLAMVATLAIGGTLAYFTDNDSAVNVVTMGKVDIELVETSDDGEVTDEGIIYENVMPGDELDKDVNVQVVAGSQSAYIAVKVEVVGEAIAPEKLAGIQMNVGEDWTLVKTKDTTNTYFYVYKNAVSAETDLDVFDTVTIPGSEWTNVEAQGSFEIKVTAYAIQEKNVEADTAKTELLKLAELEESVE